MLIIKTKQSKIVKMGNKVESVVITKFGPPVTQVDDQWPLGDLVGALAEEKSPSLPFKYWQTSVRWALLRKYGYDDTGIPTEEQAYQMVQGARRLVFSNDQVEAIRKKWESILRDAAVARAEPAATKMEDNDLVDFLRHSTSRGRDLQWAIMDCAAGTQFHLHAHPNLEVAHCVRGTLHEVRVQGDPYDKGYQPHPQDPSKLKGPNLTQLHRPWYFCSLRQGEWLVNEAGSIHKSFTATSGDGCLLLVLWSGSHADILSEEEPVKVNVQDAVDTMDERLGQCACTKWDNISETFLPVSEKKRKRV
jgi:hypothetical protein